MNSSKQQKQKKNTQQNDFIMYQQPAIDYTMPSLPSLDRLVHTKMEESASTPIPSQAYPKQPVFTQPKTDTPSLDNNSSTFYQRSDIDIYQPPPSTYYPLDQDEHRIYSFMPLESVFQQKRPRRKFNEIERLYQCNYLNCTKAYGTLNHLNAHISMQEHGPKRLPIEFKELRKQLRKTKAQAVAKNKSNTRPDAKRDSYHGEFSNTIMIQQQQQQQPSSYPQPIAPLQQDVQQHLDHGSVQHQVSSLPHGSRSQHMATQQVSPPQPLPHQMTQPRHMGSSQPMRPSPPQKIAHMQQMALPQQMTPPQPMPPQQQQQFQQNYPPQPTFQQYQIMQQQQQQQQQQQFH